MKINIDVTTNKVVLTADINGHKIEYGWEYEGEGVWTHIGKSLESYVYEGILSERQAETLDAIELTSLADVVREDEEEDTEENCTLLSVRLENLETHKDKIGKKVDVFERGIYDEEKHDIYYRYIPMIEMECKLVAIMKDGELHEFDSEEAALNEAKAIRDKYRGSK